jgi:hypothetical protein
LLLLAQGIHKAKVEAERNSVISSNIVNYNLKEELTNKDKLEDNINKDRNKNVEVRLEKKKKRKKVESLKLKEYRNLFIAQN